MTIWQIPSLLQCLDDAKTLTAQNAALQAELAQAKAHVFLVSTPLLGFAFLLVLILLAAAGIALLVRFALGPRRDVQSAPTTRQSHVPPRPLPRPAQRGWIPPKRPPSAPPPDRGAAD